MTYQHKTEWKAERLCAECSKPFMPNSHNQRYCSHECKNLVSMRNFKHSDPEYWARYMKEKKANTRRKPDSLKPKYNPEPCRLCKRPLGRTVNHWYHLECHRRISNLTGIEEVGVQL